MSPVASIIVTNHNYGRWLREAIDSALNQTYGGIEVVVVDDGSTDDSREIIASYGARITPVLQPNLGQAAAINAGFAASTGDPVLVLDADDVLRATAIERAVEALRDPAVAQVHWLHHVIDEDSRLTGELFPSGLEELPEGDLREAIARFGPGTLLTTPTSGNVFRRSVLERIMPITAEVRMCADQHMIQLVPLLGNVARLSEPQSHYRRHGSSGFASVLFDDQLELGYDVMEQLMGVCASWCGEVGLDADVAQWRRSSWYHALRHIVGELDRLSPDGRPILLIDDGQTGMENSRVRSVLPFPSRDGIWWGAVAGDDEAIAQLEHHRERGAAHLAVMWTAVWWLDHYRGFAAHLSERYRRVCDDDLVTVFDLSG